MRVEGSGFVVGLVESLGLGRLACRLLDGGTWRRWWDEGMPRMAWRGSRRVGLECCK